MSNLADGLERGEYAPQEIYNLSFLTEHDKAALLMAPLLASESGMRLFILELVKKAKEKFRGGFHPHAYRMDDHVFDQITKVEEFARGETTTAQLTRYFKRVKTMPFNAEELTADDVAHMMVSVFQSLQEVQNDLDFIGYSETEISPAIMSKIIGDELAPILLNVLKIVHQERLH